MEVIVFTDLLNTIEMVKIVTISYAFKMCYDRLAQQLRTLVALAKDLGSVLSTLIVAKKHL